MSIIKSLLAAVMVLWSIAISAQDTSRKKTIDITSTFKPVLKEAAKINFNAAPPAADGRKPVLQYKVPSQNLLLGYQPVPIQPLALQADSASAWQNSNYIKVGIGNIILPYVQAGLSFGDGKTRFYNIFANHHSANGSLPFQKNNRTEVTAAATYKTPGNLEWDGKIGFVSQQYFLYGYSPSTLVFTKDQLRQRFQTFGGKLSLRNLEPTEYGINYNPNIRISVFSGTNDIDKATEANSVLNIPVQKTINDQFSFKLGITADLTNFRPRDTATIQNNLYYVSPAIAYLGDQVSITAGIIPSWQNKEFRVLPNFMADISPEDMDFTIQLGWIGYYNKGSYERFASINPWLSQPLSLLNTKVQEAYGGLKGTLARHFTYSAKLGYVSYRNMPLFVNDSVDGKTFNILYASSMQSFQLHGEIGYIQGERFNASAFITINNYRIKEQPKAYGLQPVELGATLRWQAVKNLWVNSDFNVLGGAPYITTNKITRSGKSGIDLSAGLEYKIARQVNVWFQMNNIFNNKYERWNQYPVYGFNVLGGIIFSFNQK